MHLNRETPGQAPGGGSGNKTAASAVHTTVSGHGYDSCSGADGIQVKYKEERRWS